MAGYEQQDAHEFYITMLNSIHNSLQGKNSNCTCIAHSTFSGTLQSSVICAECENISTSHDLFFDIPLDIKLSTKSILGCLDSFTATERLSKNTYYCHKCQDHRGCEKKMTIHTFPKVICLQLKRFEHNSVASKLTQFVSFPLDISLNSYTSSSSSSSSSADHDYTLYSVVTHLGTMDKGHYICHSKYGGDWFCFDDAWVKKSSEREVLALNAYMLFYIKK